MEINTKRNNVAILIIVLSIFLLIYFLYNEAMTSPDKNSPTGMYFLIVSIIIALALFQNFFNRFIATKILKTKGIKSKFIHKEINCQMEYLEEDGSLVSFYRKDRITKLSLKKNTTPNIYLYIDKGEIRNISTINCGHQQNGLTQVNFISNLDQKHIINKSHCSTYYLECKNAFLGSKQTYNEVEVSKEFWNIEMMHYCLQYNLSVILPKGKLYDCELYYKEIGDSKEEWHKSNDFMPLKRRNAQHDIIDISITQLKIGEVYRLVWYLNV